MKKIVFLFTAFLVFSTASLYAQSAQTHLNNGKRFFDQWKYDGQRSNYNAAIRELTEAIRLNPDLAEAYALRSQLHFFDSSRNKYYPKDYDTLADANSAIRINPRLAMGYYARGSFYHIYSLDNSLDDKKQALADYTEAIRLDPNYADAYFYRGLIHSSNGDYSRAIADYEAALRLNPKNIDAANGLARARQAQGSSSQPSSTAQGNSSQSSSTAQGSSSQSRTNTQQQPRGNNRALNNTTWLSYYEGTVLFTGVIMPSWTKYLHFGNGNYRFTSSISSGDTGTYSISGDTVTFTSSNGTTMLGTLIGNSLTYDGNTFTRIQ